MRIHITAKTIQNTAQQLYTCTFLLSLYFTPVNCRGLLGLNTSIGHTPLLCPCSSCIPSSSTFSSCTHSSWAHYIHSHLFALIIYSVIMVSLNMSHHECGSSSRTPLIKYFPGKSAAKFFLPELRPREGRKALVEMPGFKRAPGSGCLLFCCIYINILV
jgi:hypothetical protein